MLRFLPLLLLLGAPAFAAENLIRDGGFEAPAVTGRTAQAKGGDPSLAKPRNWISFDFQMSGTGKGIEGGLTDEAHHSGKQALYIEFNHVAQSYRAVTLTSNFIPVAAGTDYDVGIWGNIDAKNPIAAGGRSAYLKLQVDYFAKDANESVGETVYSVQPLPGSRDRPAFFKPGVWKLFFTKVTTPADAVFAQVSWRWETGSDAGETNGTIYFDDASFYGAPAANPNLTPAPAVLPVPAEASGTGAAPAEAGGSPAAGAGGAAGQ